MSNASDHNIPHKHAEPTAKAIEGEVGGTDGWTGTGEKLKLTRNRKPSSCAQCRKRKLRCNRGNPCTNCLAKGETCDWQGGAAPLFDSRQEHDAQALRLQVTRLEELVKFLTAQEGNRPPTGDLLNSVNDYFRTKSTTESPNASPPLPAALKLQSFPKKNALQSHILRNAEVEELKLDLRAADLCEALSQLTIREFVVLEGSGGDSWSPCGGGSGSGAEFVEEAKEFITSMPQRFGITGNFPSLRASSYSDGSSGASRSRMGSRDDNFFSPSALGVQTFHLAAPPLSEVFKYLPTDKEALSAYTYYSGYVSWYSHPVHLPTFEAQWADLKRALLIEDPIERANAIDPFFVATFLGIIGIGLASMPIKRATRDGFGDEKERTTTVDKWFEGAMVALSCGRFLDNPSVESVRAVVVISTYFVFMATGESSGAGMGLLSLAVQVALSLSLHRDPNKIFPNNGKFTFFEAEERRRLFWSLFMLCILSSASLGRTWAVFDLNNVDCELPYDCHDSEILAEVTAKAGTEARRSKSEETPMTSLLVKIKLSVLAKKINDRAFGIHQVGYSTVMELDADLNEFESSIPQRYQLRLDSLGRVVRPTVHVTVTEMRACMIQISVASEFIRIHRPWLARRDSAYQYSRDQCIKYSKLLLAIYRTPSCNKVRWGGLTYKATSAATILAIEIICFPDGSDCDSLRASIRSAAVQMETFLTTSSLCRKGSRLLRFLLEKEAGMIAQREAERESKRSRRQIQGPIRALFNEGANTFSRPAHSISEEEFYHKNQQIATPSYSNSATSSQPIYQSQYQQYSDPRRTEVRPLPISRYPLEPNYSPPMPQMHSNASSSSGYNSIQQQNNPAGDFATDSRAWSFDFAMPHPLPNRSPPSSNRSSYSNYPPPSQVRPHYVTDYNFPHSQNPSNRSDSHSNPTSPYINLSTQGVQEVQEWAGGVSLSGIESKPSLSYY